MRLSRDDKRFLVGLAAAAVVLGVYYGPIRAALRAPIADLQAKQEALREEHADLFRPGGQPVGDAEAALDAHAGALAQRLGELRRAVEFDPAAVLDPLDRGAGTSASPQEYRQLSQSLHDKLRGVRDRQDTPTRIPPVFDPQGDIRAPVDAARVPALHLRLLAAYSALRAAVESHVDALDCQVERPPSQPDATAPLERIRLRLKLRGTLDELAAFLHRVSARTPGDRASRFLSVGHADIAPSRERSGMVEADLLLVAVRLNPQAAPATKRE
jgi:hypothetical protein